MFFLDCNNLTKKIYEANHQLESSINILRKDEIKINKSNSNIYIYIYNFLNKGLIFHLTFNFDFFFNFLQSIKSNSLLQNEEQLNLDKFFFYRDNVIKSNRKQIIKPIHIN